MASEEALYKKVDKAIGRYYVSLGKTYNNELEEFCEENGYDENEDEFKEEMDQDAEECLLVDFDDNFPFSEEAPTDEDGKKQYIYNLIKKCIENTDMAFGSRSNIPQFEKVGRDLFSTQQGHLDKICTIYSTQCPAFWTTECSADGGLLTMLATGKKHGFEYLIHLVDDYNRWRIKHKDKNGQLPTSEWTTNHPHFEQMQKQNISLHVLTGQKSAQKDYRSLVQCAVDSFGKRICNKLELKPLKRIDDSLENIVNYIYHAVNFVWNQSSRSHKEGTICPFQMDFCFAVGPALDDEKDEVIGDDDDDDDDGGGDNKEDIDYVGNIKEKLKANGLKHAMYRRPDIKDHEEQKDSRIFGKLYDGFLEQNNLDKLGAKSKYLHNKRLIAMIDRRESKGDQVQEDIIWLYEPPKDCNNCHQITNDTVPEWYFNSSIACLLPNVDYKKSGTVIGAKDHCKGSVMTLSFHVKEARRIKCYLFWQGTMIRFMPDDIRDVLPNLFNPEKAYLDNEHKAMDQKIAEMKTKLVDEEFVSFKATYNF